jgi:demethylmenaquinone methyltransferase/2-methoxy-6-polyprenyl-1,4-benzoquinol methylase
MARRGRPAQLVSTDFVPEMLEIAEQKAQRYDGPTEISFRVADAQDLPFGDGEFECATVGFGVRNLPDRERNFSEVHRVLSPGGSYVILEFSRPRLAPWRWLYHAYLRVFVPFLGWLLARDRASYRYLNDSIRSFPTQQALADELVAAGFSQVTWRNLTGGIVAVHVARKAR